MNVSMPMKILDDQMIDGLRTFAAATLRQSIPSKSASNCILVSESGAACGFGHTKRVLLSRFMISTRPVPSQTIILSRSARPKHVDRTIKRVELERRSNISGKTVHSFTKVDRCGHKEDAEISCRGDHCEAHTARRTSASCAAGNPCEIEMRTSPSWMSQVPPVGTAAGCSSKMPTISTKLGTVALVAFELRPAFNYRPTTQLVVPSSRATVAIV